MRVVILDDHPLLVEGYLSRLRPVETIEVVGWAYHGEGFEDLLRSQTLPVNVALIDVEVPVAAGKESSYPVLAAIPRLLQQYPSLNILIVSMHDNATLIRSVMNAGACGYVLKEDSYFLKAMPEILDLIANGGMYMSPLAHQKFFRNLNHNLQLTPRQVEVLSMCAAYPEASLGELAERMGLAGSTLRNSLSNAYFTLEVHSRTAAVARAQQLGLISPIHISLDLKNLGGS